ncbi:MAG: MaoC/PaaZ C-terminal domain-containing protein [Proteobacteria bacterium]|nr:MaoC/PaaZ C-terminal domain-containing protein [Pseudomonadota bacterium]
MTAPPATRLPPTRRLGDVHVGDELPELAIEVTPTLVIAGAFASRDLTRVHHDKTDAQARGLQDVIMNTLTTNGLVSRFVTDWAGPEAVVRRLHLKLGAPNLPGDTMKLTATVRAVDEGGAVVSLEIAGTNAWGKHVTGSVELVLPKGV